MPLYSLWPKDSPFAESTLTKAGAFATYALSETGVFALELRAFPLGRRGCSLCRTYHGKPYNLKTIIFNFFVYVNKRKQPNMIYLEFIREK